MQATQPLERGLALVINVGRKGTDGPGVASHLRELLVAPVTHGEDRQLLTLDVARNSEGTGVGAAGSWVSAADPRVTQAGRLGALADAIAGLTTSESRAFTREEVMRNTRQGVAFIASPMDGSGFVPVRLAEHPALAKAVDDLEYVTNQVGTPMPDDLLLEGFNRQLAGDLPGEPPNVIA